MTLKFNKTYALITLMLFTTEILIALYLKSSFIRHTFGDFLVVILIYGFFKSFVKGNSFKLGLSVLIFAYIIEFLQLAKLVTILNMQNNRFITLLLGNTFSTADLMAYTLGIMATLSLEYKYNKPNVL
ncbi:DUF2809 domain-containing protein [Mariniflexile ostreae]|uniref:DUF2809 domain-containing protein n=1 Tax=Mariniflexile ostreae TaxID=1520892 RepID=A0ABV5FF33_9FLAO